MASSSIGRLGKEGKLGKKTWEDAKVGDELGSVQYKLTSEDISRHLLGIEDHNPWYVQESPFGGPVAPPLITSNEYFTLYSSHFIDEGFLHAKTEVEIKNPLFLGKLITVRGSIADKYIRRERKYIVIETTVTDEGGMEISRSRNTLASIKKLPG